MSLIGTIWTRRCVDVRKLGPARSNLRAHQTRPISPMASESVLGLSFAIRRCGGRPTTCTRSVRVSGWAAAPTLSRPRGVHDSVTVT